MKNTNGNNALVRESTIGKNCIVGYNTEVARSWIGQKVLFLCNYIGDSVIEGSIFNQNLTDNQLYYQKEKFVIKSKNRE